jgi:hypothetical protein
MCNLITAKLRGAFCVRQSDAIFNYAGNLT